MNQILTTSDYGVQQGRFLIVPTNSGDLFTDVHASIQDGSDEARAIAVTLADHGFSGLRGQENEWWIHDGFIIADLNDSRRCADVLMVKTQDEANAALAEYLAELNA